MQIMVSSSIDSETYHAWKKTGMKLNHVIKLGLMAANQTPGYINRINELEEGNQKLQRKLSEVMDKLRSIGGGVQ